MATQLNKEFFDKEAATYDAKHERTLEYLIQKIRAQLDFIGVEWASEADDDSLDSGADHGHTTRAVRLLDYACGTGNVSRALAPYTTQCVGIDLSEGMVAAYNQRASNQGLSQTEMFAYQGNLCDPSDPDPPSFAGPTFHNFDVAAVGLGFHHFDDPELAAARLVQRLRPGGVLVIIDFTPHGPFAGAHDEDGEHKHDHPHAAAAQTVTHHGFSEERMREIFEKAGAGGEFGIADLGAISLPGKDHGGKEKRRRVFLARGTKL
ncbi:hypothetical protein VTK73DRAFT_9359 [Phialemonium thermophilum]|uniref:Methyltransferase type 12 domain-containing protein n=1 Tax=Phialemonium thermophilum TaxID=223376 RepID=A0ABR3XL15_9PEZI